MAGSIIEVRTVRRSTLRSERVIDGVMRVEVSAEVVSSWIGHPTTSTENSEPPHGVSGTIRDLFTVAEFERTGSCSPIPVNGCSLDHSALLLHADREALAQRE